MIYALEEDKIYFPNPRLGEPDGMLAVGGDLSVDRLLLAYSHGIFPWYDYRNEPITWWCPMQRFVIFPNEIHISHSMRQLIKSAKYSVTVNQAFDDVIENCSKAQGRNEMDGAWLGSDMKAAYRELNRQNLAASIEVWDGDRLVGGLYGVIIGRNFFGESMFSLVPNASKLALIELANILKKTGKECLIDCQLRTDHLASMGGRYIDYDEYIRILRLDSF